MAVRHSVCRDPARASRYELILPRLRQRKLYVVSEFKRRSIMTMKLDPGPDAQDSEEVLTHDE